MQFSHSKEFEGTVEAKDFISGLLTFTFRLRDIQTQQVYLPSSLAYPSGCIPINIKKMDDLKKLKRFLPHTNAVKKFYDDIFQWPTCDCEFLENDE